MVERLSSLYLWRERPWVEKVGVGKSGSSKNILSAQLQVVLDRNHVFPSSREKDDKVCFLLNEEAWNGSWVRMLEELWETH